MTSPSQFGGPAPAAAPNNVNAAMSIGSLGSDRTKKSTIALNQEVPPEESHLFLTQVIGLRDSWPSYFKHIFCCIFFNILYVLFSAWWPHRYYMFRYDYVTDLPLDQADHVLVTDSLKRQTLCAVEPVRPIASYERAMGIEDNIPAEQSEFYRDKMFVYRNRRYIYNSISDMFELLHCPKFLDGPTLTQRRNGIGLELIDYVDNATLYGRNILRISAPSWISLLIDGFLDPFFVFQVYSVIVWICEQYWMFAPVIAIMALASVILTAWDTKENFSRLQSLARHEDYISVVRNGQVIEINADQLIVGDLVLLKQGRVSCDVTILRGSAVINEAMLTGESLPVRKVALDFSTTAKRVNITNDRNIIYGGTSILQLKPDVIDENNPQDLTFAENGVIPVNSVLAIVTRVGYYTTNGNLISSILFPQEPDFEFTNQTYKYLGVLFCMALVGFAVTVWRYSLEGVATSLIVLRSLDLVTIVVPPSLPLAMSTAVNFALNNLKKKNIFCINGSVIPMSGKVKLCCFDKTGTLTTDTLVVRGVFSHLSSLYHEQYAAQNPHIQSFVNHPKSALLTSNSTLANRSSSQLTTTGNRESDHLLSNPTSPRREYNSGGFTPQFPPAGSGAYGSASSEEDLPRPSITPSASTTAHGNEGDDDDDDDDEDDVLDVPESQQINPEIIRDNQIPLILRDLIACCHSLTIDTTQDRIDCTSTSQFPTSSSAPSQFLSQFQQHDQQQKAFVQQIVGDPLEIAAFDSVRAIFEENPIPGAQFAVTLFPFHPHVAAPVASSSDDLSPSVDQSYPTLPAPPQDHFGDGIVVTPSLSVAAPIKQEWYVLRTFAFDSSVQRMSVLALHAPSKRLFVFLKGAPEVLFDLCKEAYVEPSTRGNGAYKQFLFPDDTLNPAQTALVDASPDQIDTQEQALLMYEHKRKVESYSRCGYRVLGLALREISLFAQLVDPNNPATRSLLGVVDLAAPMHTFSVPEIITNVNAVFNAFESAQLRTRCEQSARFVGLLVLENQLKAATKPTIHHLLTAGLRCVMITGDNIRTAVAVSKESGILQPNTGIFVSEIRPRSRFKHLPARELRDPRPETHQVIWRNSENPRITLDPTNFNIIAPVGVDVPFVRYELALSGPALTLLLQQSALDKVAASAGVAPLAPDANEQLIALSSPNPLLQNDTMSLASRNTADSNNWATASIARSHQTHRRESGMKTSSAAASTTLASSAIHDLDQVAHIQRVLLATTTLARFTPDQKALAVTEYMKMGFYVSFVGDGANDASSLRAAHIGVSLADTEASIAAPFTSQITDISALIHVLSEGRSTLVSAFLLFRYMAMYSFAQFFCVLLLYWRGGNLCDFQFLYQDLFAVFPVALVMARTAAAPHLTVKRPGANLLSATNLIGVVTHMMISGVTQWVIFAASAWPLLSPNYSLPPNPDHVCLMPEATTVNYSVSLQYVYYAFIFSTGPFARRWKQSVFSNKLYILVLALSTAASVCCILFGPTKFPLLYPSNSDQPIDTPLRYFTLVWAVFSALCVCINENVIVPALRFISKQRLIKRRTNTVYGAGSDRFGKGGAKIYHIVRRQFEDMWNHSTIVRVQQRLPPLTGSRPAANAQPKKLGNKVL